MPGPAPEPTALKELKGNPGKRALNTNEPKPDVPARPPDPPEYLPKFARQEWRYMVKNLWKLGLYTKIDRGVFIAYCMAWDRFRTAELDIKAIALKQGDSGHMIKTKNGNYVHNPALSISRKAQEDVVKYAQQMGMTPSARTRVASSPSKPTVVPDDKPKGDDGKKAKRTYYRKG